jgi:hypothetical protein
MIEITHSVQCPNQLDRICPRLATLATFEESRVDAGDDRNQDSDPSNAAGNSIRDTARLAAHHTEHAFRAPGKDCASLPENKCPVSIEIAESRTRNYLVEAAKKLLGIK